MREPNLFLTYQIDEDGYQDYSLLVKHSDVNSTRNGRTLKITLNIKSVKNLMIKKVAMVVEDLMVAV